MYDWNFRNLRIVGELRRNFHFSILGHISVNTIFRPNPTTPLIQPTLAFASTSTSSPSVTGLKEFSVKDKDGSIKKKMKKTKTLERQKGRDKEFIDYNENFLLFEIKNIKDE